MTDCNNINWHERYLELEEKGELDPNALFACPCCGYPTKSMLGDFCIG